jgi:hypothetical protein
MLGQNKAYATAVAASFPQAEYDPVVDCTNYLFHRHTAEIPPAFRPAACSVLSSLLAHSERQPIVLTNSLGDKVQRQLSTLALDSTVSVLGDTRQYDMDPSWTHHFCHPELGNIQVWPVTEDRQVDLRRPAYYRALMEAASGGAELTVVADTFSLPGAVPLLMGIPFILIHSSYTPTWCVEVVRAHPLGVVVQDLGELPQALDAIFPDL